jgi:mRNA-degrading endonuclease RelE of RelBE toxin-antitoxin system
MTIEYDRKFIKDFQTVPQHIKIAFAEIHSDLETALTLRKINQCRKLKGSDNMYRIRLGNYRATFYLKNPHIIEFLRILPRGQVYKGK